MLLLYSKSRLTYVGLLLCKHKERKEDYKMYELMSERRLEINEGLSVFLSEIQVIINYNKRKVKSSLQDDLEQEIRMKIVELIEKKVQNANYHP